MHDIEHNDEINFKSIVRDVPFDLCSGEKVFSTMVILTSFSVFVSSHCSHRYTVHR